MPRCEFSARYDDLSDRSAARSAALGFIAVAPSSAEKPKLSSTLIVGREVIGQAGERVVLRYGVDDRAARQFGGHLGTLADVVDFFAAPAVALLVGTENSSLGHLIGLPFILVAIGRHARFEVVGAVGRFLHTHRQTKYAAHLGASVRAFVSSLLPRRMGLTSCAVLALP